MYWFYETCYLINNETHHILNNLFKVYWMCVLYCILGAQCNTTWFADISTFSDYRYNMRFLKQNGIYLSFKHIAWRPYLKVILHAVSRCITNRLTSQTKVHGKADVLKSGITAYFGPWMQHLGLKRPVNWERETHRALLTFTQIECELYFKMFSKVSVLNPFDHLIKVSVLMLMHLF